MPRHAREHTPGCLIHCIVRFVDREFRLVGPSERTLYLGRLERALRRTDWLLLAYALMSSHVHLTLLAGEAPMEAFARSLHTAVGLRLNKMHGRLGPALAERPTTIAMPTERTCVLVPYIHNNPGRAGLVSDPAQSTWTSHRAWIGLDPAPSFLKVELGLALAGFDATTLGRRRFHELVVARSPDPRDPALSCADLGAWRRAARYELAAPVEVATPHVGFERGTTFGILHPGPAVLPWRGDLRELADLVMARCDVSLAEMRSPSRARRIAHARRLFVTTAVVELRRRPLEVAGFLAISKSAVSAHFARGAGFRAAAEAMGTALRAKERPNT